MASPTKVDQSRPGTLPADFGEWDSGDIPVTLPDNFDGFDAAAPPFVPIEKTHSHAGKARNSNWKPVDQAPKSTSLVPTASPVPSASPTVAPPVQVDERMLALPLNETKVAKRKIVMIVIGGVFIVLLVSVLLTYRVNRPRHLVTMSSAVPPIQLRPAPVAFFPAPKPQDVLQVTRPPAPTSKVEPEPMNIQLNAPTQIPRNLNRVVEQEAPALSGTVIDGLGNNSGAAINGAFQGKGIPVVKVDENKMVNISAGVAEGLLLRKVLPTYPPIAKASKVSGTVVLRATISKAGSIENLKLIDGPIMLRQSALEAVKQWHYKPYLLNSQPVEVETTINVVFSLGK